MDMNYTSGDEELLQALAEAMQSQSQPQQSFRQPQYGVLEEPGYRDLRGQPVNTRGASQQQLAEMLDNPVDPRTGLYKFPMGLSLGTGQQIGAQERAEADRVRRFAAGEAPMPGINGAKNLNQLRDLAESLKTLDPKFAGAVLSKITGIDPELQREAALRRMAQFKYNLGADDRDANRQGRIDTRKGREEAAMLQRESLKLQRDAQNDSRNETGDRTLLGLVNKMKKEGRSVAEIQAAVKAMGRTSTVSPTGLFGWGSGTVDVDPRRPATASGIDPSSPATPLSPLEARKQIASELARRAGVDPNKMSDAEKQNLWKAAGKLIEGAQPVAPQVTPAPVAPVTPAPVPQPHNIFEPAKPPPPAPSPISPAAKAAEMDQKRVEQLKRAKVEDAYQKRQKAQRADQEKEQQQQFDDRQKKLEEEARIKHELELLRIRRFRLQH